MHMNQLQELEPSTEQGTPVSHIWPFQDNHNCKAQLILYQKTPQNFIRISS